jgi:Transglycosylase SLT domain
MQPVNNPRRRAWRTVLSALAGGGLTAASLSGQIPSALAGVPAPAEGSTPPVATNTGSTPEAGSPQPSSTSSTPAPSGSPTTSTSTGPQPSTPPPASEAPTVVLQHKQKRSTGGEGGPSQGTSPSKQSTPKTTATGPNNVALSPQLVAARAGALAAQLASSAASVQALSFYRIPPFLLPVYKAAAAQYGVPWQILAAINEIETNFGSDQSVSTAGAVGWMQFMPATWLQYGVDALNAGYADPYNPVDAIFAAARYLRAAGAATDLHGAILAYNHSEEYVSSVLLRAKLISTYPRPVVATLTGLVDSRLPVTGTQVAWGAPPSSPSSATANTVAAEATSSPSTATPGSSAAPSPAAAAAGAPGTTGARLPVPLQLVDLLSAPSATVVAVQDGRIVRLGESRELGKYVILRDVYGDIFTYAGLGSIAHTYTPEQTRPAAPRTPAATIAKTHDHAPVLPASAGSQPSLTLHVRTPALPQTPRAAQAILPGGAAESVPAGMGRVRMFAHPGNPDALAAAARAADLSGSRRSGRRLPLRRGAVVASGTVLGHVRTPPGASNGHMRFAIRPAGDAGTIDPRPILASWVQLATALHPKGAKPTAPLLGATASDVFLLSKEQLVNAVLADPGISLDACGRQDVTAGAVDQRVLAMLAFLSRSGLKPTVAGLRCGAGHVTPAGAAAPQSSLDSLDITAVNDTAIAAHQGPGTVTDVTIRTLLSLPGEFLPKQIVSLMRYPGAANTHATPQAWNHIHVAFAAAATTVALSPGAAATAAHSAGVAATTTPPPPVVGGDLTPAQWDQLIKRISALPAPTVRATLSTSAIPDPKHP